MIEKKDKSNRDFLGTNKREHLIQHWHIVTIALMLYDIIAVNMAYFLALWVRFDCSFSNIPEEYFNAFL